MIEPDFPDPQPPPGWVTVRVHACSVNFHDIFTRRGMPGITISFPLIVGSDLAGRVESLGDGVSNWKQGDRVLVDPLPCKGTDWKFVGEQFCGGRAELCAVHASQLVAVPEQVSLDTAACIPLAYATAHRMLIRRARLAPGETILVLGASGGVGTACVLIAKLIGAHVIACGSSRDKLGKLSGLGADDTVLDEGEGFRDAVWKLAGRPGVQGEGGVDVVVNFTGGQSWHDSIRCLKRKGRLVTCGATAGFQEEIDIRYVWTFEHELIGSNGWRRTDIQTLLEYAERNRLLPVIDRVLPLHEVHRAEQLLEERAVFGKIVLRPPGVST